MALAAQGRFAAGSAQDLFGFGVAAPAKLGAVAAQGAGWESVYYNPAGLAGATSTQIAVGWTAAGIDVRATGAGLGTDDDPAAAASAGGALLLGAAIPLPLPGWWDRRIALGLGLHVPRENVLRARVPAPYTPQFAVVGNRANALSIQAGLGFAVTDWLRVGGGVRALARLRGKIEVATNEQGKLRSSVRDELLVDLAPTFGVSAGAFAGVTLGIGFRGEQRSDFDLPIEAEIPKLEGFGIPTLRIEGTAQFDPRQVQSGVGWSSEGALGPWTLSAEVDLLWRQWSRAPRPIENTTEPLPPQPPVGASDTWSPRVATQLDWAHAGWQLTGRLAYAFEPSPFGAQDSQRALLDNDRHIVALGLGGRWQPSPDQSARIGIDGYAQLHLLDEREHSRPSGALTTGGQLWAAGFAVQVEF